MQLLAKIKPENGEPEFVESSNFRTKKDFKISLELEGHEVLQITDLEKIKTW